MFVKSLQFAIVYSLGLFSISTTNATISSFVSNEAFVSPGETVDLSWTVVGDANSILLNNLNVTGQSGQTVTPSGQSNYKLNVTTTSNQTDEEEVTVFSLAEGEVIISEFQASNDSTLTDEDGDSSDWIEIHNPTSAVADLTDYYLTDDIDDAQKWRFPATTIEAGGYLVVFASSKDRAVSGSELHTNFSLSSGGEYLALVKPDGVRATEFSPEYPEVPSDISYGYDSSELGFRFFEQATPGSDNGVSFEGFVGEAEFSVERGIYEVGFSLVLTSSTPDAVIRYTLDGTEPTATTGLIYGPGAITINETSVVRAFASKDGLLGTRIATHSYIFPADVVTQPEMRPEITEHPTYGPKVLESIATVPTISLSFAGNDIDREEIPLSVEMLNFESGSTQLNAGAARFGSFNTDFAKRSFRLEFRSRYGPSRLEFPLFNNREYNIPAVESFDSLDVRAGNHDMVLRGAYMGNPFGDDSMIDMGHVAPHGRFVNIYFNGEYRGMYHLRERWNAAMLSDYLPGEEEEFDTINANTVSYTHLTLPTTPYV